jgi:hypothetical protein
MTLVQCEACGQRVARMFRAQTGPDVGRWRIIRHKTQTQAGRYVRVDWCRGKFEAEEATR